ncbi:MAG: hypothetical protein JHC13_05200 [Acidilobus sp.]|nr:hypothetical protein [Acidilobus sp.]
MEKGRWPLVLAIVLLSLIIAAYVAMAHVVFLYQANIMVKPVSSPITVIPGQCPCGCSSWSQTLTGFSTTITAYTLRTTSGYVLTTPLVKFNVTVSGTLTMSLSSSSSVVSDYVNGTMIYPSPGSFSLSAGSYLMIQRLTLSSPVTSTLTLSGQYSYTYTPGVRFLYSFTETISPPSANVMNLLNGQNAIYVPHVYQGDYQGSGTGSWPVYYGPSTASQYWSPLSSGISQPVLMMVPAQGTSAGAMFWSETYSGGSVTITVIGSFSQATTNPADAFEIYLFLRPTRWGISSAYNWSIPYTSTPAWRGTTYPSPVEGDVILPQSSTSYLVIQWSPYWQIAYSTSGATGQWNVWIVTNSRGNNPSVSPRPSPNLDSNYAGWDGIGTGAFKPNPGDYICVTVTYNPSTNTLSGVAYDLNTGQSASFTVNLGNNYRAPGGGSYVFGIAGSTGGAYANWAVVYVNYQG